MTLILRVKLRSLICLLWHLLLCINTFAHRFGTREAIFLPMLTSPLCAASSITGTTHSPKEPLRLLASPARLSLCVLLGGAVVRGGVWEKEGT